jgi:predicted nuclease of predicted toxin-antitoxin system
LARIKFLTDEDFRDPILEGVRARLPDLDIVRVQDVGLRTRPDPEILEFAAFEGRILLTHDTRTMETHVRARINAGKPMPGVFVIRQQVPIGQAIDAIIMVVECSEIEEWNDIIKYLPL